MFLGANTPECESAISLRGAKVPGSEKAKERKSQGANWPGSEKAVNQVVNIWTQAAAELRGRGHFCRPHPQICVRVRRN